MTARRWARALVAVTMAATAGGCVPLFVPPVPTDGLTPAPAWRVAGDARAEVVPRAVGAARGLRLTMRFEEVPREAWVAVQWFGPAGGERASESRWITPADVGRTLTWVAPADLEITPGRWRAVLSVGDRLLRQIDAEVPAGAP